LAVIVVTALVRGLLQRIRAVEDVIIGRLQPVDQSLCELASVVMATSGLVTIGVSGLVAGLAVISLVGVGVVRGIRVRVTVIGIVIGIGIRVGVLVAGLAFGFVVRVFVGVAVAATFGVGIVTIGVTVGVALSGLAVVGVVAVVVTVAALAGLVVLSGEHREVFVATEDLSAQPHQAGQD
jgi:hypothetical protein